ncbi:MAG: DUF4139 domain-containing protein [Candidatus Cloacimonetes bacterium]|nr:DUF4139 domain-containing protein [Candidatus Cloacimonadota bacterium]
MKIFTKTTILLISFVLLASPSIFSQTSITVYNQNFATVRTNLTIPLQKGENLYSFSDIPSAIEPTSVHLTPVKKSDKIVIALQNFEYDLANTQKILNKYLDKEIEIVVKNGDLFSGILKSFDHENIVIQRREDKGINMIHCGEIQNINLEKMPENFYTKPTLNWELISNKSGDCETKLSYITRNISWDAQYVAVLSPNEKSLNLSSWISLDNRSGKAYKQVDLKLMAGDVHLAPDQKKMYGDRDLMLVEAKGLGVPEIVEKEFFEYHLYTVKNRKIDINNNQQKQISLFDPTDVTVEKIFRYNCNSSGDVNVLIKFKNEEEYGLGIPLPKGKIRIFKKESEDEEEFIGADNINHTPKNEEVELKVGTAFDIKGKFTTTLSERPTKNTRRETYEIELRNRKEEDVVIEAIKRLGRNWKIEESDEEYEKKDAFTIQFNIQVPAEQKKKFSFTVLYKY